MCGAGLRPFIEFSGNPMDIERLISLMDWMSGTPLVELEWSNGDERVRLVKAPETVTEGRPATVVAGGNSVPAGEANNDANIVRAPFLGIVHLAPEPDAPAYIGIGKLIGEGETLCIIEAMKIFNAVHAERGGIVEEILVASGEQVGVDQPLFRIAPVPDTTQPDMTSQI